MRVGAKDQIELVLIRHGATESNRERRYVGRTDEPLSPEGRGALRAAKETGMYPPVSRVFCSPMRRCVTTAQLLYPEQEPVLIPEWEEMDFGAFEGKTYQDLRRDRRYQEWIDSGGSLPFPGGESREAFSLRCERGFCRMLELLSPEKTEGAAAESWTALCVLSQLPSPVEGTVGSADASPRSAGGDGNGCGCGRIGRIGLVVHGGTIMALLSRYAGGDYFSYQVPNGGGYRCLLSRQVHRNSGGCEELRLIEVQRLGSGA